MERVKLSTNIFKSHSSNRIMFNNRIVLDAKRKIIRLPKSTVTVNFCSAIKEGGVN